MSSFTLKLITPAGVTFEGDTSEISLPTPDGQITVLANHEPIISLISPGEIVLQQNGKDHYLATEGGIIEIANNLVKVMADTAESAESLDQAKIEEARLAAKAKLTNAKDHVDFTAAEVALEKQLAKLRVLKRRRKYK